MPHDPTSPVTPLGRAPEAAEPEIVSCSFSATPADADSLPHGDILPRVLRNSFWLFNSSVVVRLLNLGRTILLARLLLPEDFGLFGLANSVIGFTAIFGDVGIGTSLIYQHEMDRRYQNTAFWMNFAVISLLLIALIVAAPLVSSIYTRPELRLVLIVLAIAFWVQVVGVVHRNLLRRQLRFGALAITEVVASIASFSVAVALAWHGKGVWAFVCALLAANIASFLSIWILSRWTPRWEWSHAALKDIGVFSGWYLAAAIVHYFAYGLDRFLVGKFLGFAVLGPYVLANDLSLALLGSTLLPIAQSSIPELATLRIHPAKFWTSYLQFSRLTALLGFLIALGVLVATPVLLPAVFGPNWKASVVPFQIFVAWIYVRAALGDPCTALGRYDLSFRIGLGLLVFGSALIPVALHFGVSWVAVVVSLISLAGVMVSVVLTSSARQLLDLLRAISPFATVATIGATIGLLAGMLAHRGAPGAYVPLVILVAAVWAGSYALLFRREFGQYKSILRLFLPKLNWASRSN